MKKNLCLIAILAWSVAQLWATDYATPRQQALATFLELKGLDTLSVGTHTHHSYKGKPLSIRINKWNEVEHIGFKLFDRTVVPKSETVLFDFIERYMLEKVAAEGTDHAIRLALDNVKFNAGTPKDVLQLSGNEAFSYNCETFDEYSIEWRKNDKTILSVTFDMDYQLLTGCNAIQLEEVFMKKLTRYKAGERAKKIDCEGFPATDYYTKEGEHFLIKSIRNDLYYQHKDNKWELISGGKEAYKALANTMLCTDAEGDYKLSLQLDKYGYKESHCVVELKALQQLCEEEGCTAYFGIKEKKDNTYTGTLFMVNNHSGYTHMLSVQVPIDAIKNKKGVIEGRMFVYIPLQNVTKKLFNQESYKNIQ